MAHPINLPTLSDTMESGQLVQWLKKPGDPVKKGDVLAEVETDKATMDVEAFYDGYLAGPLAEPDSDIPVGAVIGYIKEEPEDIQTNTQNNQASSEKIEQKQQALEDATQRESASEKEDGKSYDNEKQTPSLPENKTPPHPENLTDKSSTTPIKQEKDVKASPYARSLSRELGIDLHWVSTGHDGIIRAPQVIAAALAGPVPNLDAGPAYRFKLFTSMHKAIANNMMATVTTPTFRVSARFSLTPLKELAHTQQQSLTLLLARACALCVQQHPQFNSVYTPRALATRKQVDVGIAVDVAGGLLTPVLRDVAQRSLKELNEDWQQLRKKIKTNRLAPNEYQGATFYLSNLGVFEEVVHFDAVVPSGAAAILSLGAEQDDGKAEFTLNCDHRVVFGADAARFFVSLAQLLAEPQTHLRRT